MRDIIARLGLILTAAFSSSAATATTYTYTFNVPIDVERIAPPNSSLSLQCKTGDGSSGGFSITLDRTGTYIGTVPIVVTSSSVQSSYRCFFNPGYVDSSGNAWPAPFLPTNLLNGIGGNLVKLVPIKMH
jgi:hypothetical protein